MSLLLSIHDRFSAIAARMPDHAALADDDRVWTYGELARRSDAIAFYLQREGVKRGDRVGLYSQRSLDAVAAMLGILKAGAAYVPFDPAYPAKQLQFVYADCAPKLMLVQASLVAGTAQPFWEGFPHDLGEVGAGGGVPLAVMIQPDDAAYIMYTSGSTGHPKGVLIPHRGVVRLVIDNPFADMGADQTHLQLAPLAFDASTFEIWGALLNGGRLAVVAASQPSLDDIAASIARHCVTTLWLTAGLFHLMVDHRLEGLRPLRQLLAGGDVLSPTHIRKAQLALPDCQLINGYGPTENTTFTCCYRIPKEFGGGAVPIGLPIAHTQVHVLDDAGRAVPVGHEGELYTGGAGVALGYWNRPDLTAEKFVDDPFQPTGRAKLYRTGDRVRQRADGNFEFLGRVDRQVKINGKRVELDEIEACLRRSPSVEDAVAISPTGDSNGRKIHAYIRFRSGITISINELRDFLKSELPDYMVPSSLTAVESFPLSPTGKVDRSKLPPPAPLESATAVPSAWSGNEIEATLVGIWRKILGTSAFGLDDNFFDLGGTSLQLIALHATMTATMQSDVTVVELFEYPRIRALAARMGRSTRQTPIGAESPKAANGAVLNSEERARRQHEAMAKARAHPRRRLQ